MAGSQSTYLPMGAPEYHLLERLEIKTGKDSLLNFSKTKPFTRQHLIEALLQNQQIVVNTPNGLNRVEVYNRRLALMNNADYLPDSVYEVYRSKKPFLNRFYLTPANFFEVRKKDFLLVMNPLLQYTVGSESSSNEHLFLNSRGISLRGMIAGKIGFAASVTENQERAADYVRQWEQQKRSVPGAGFYQQFKQNGFDYFDARGSISFGITHYIDAQFGYDKNFIGNGRRSLFLSDFSAPYLFLKLNTRIWKLNYQNLFIELNSAHRLNPDQYFPKKYAAMHHLDLALWPWLNMGLFEAIIFGRQNHFEFGYLNPVIFYRSIEQQSGSFDNAVVGMDAKANLARRFQLYGQFLLDEFSLKEQRKGSGWWGNKTGWQLGGKYINAFGVSHLDLQVELNKVRPFTYSHSDSVANYTHYNQPLAHPLGANFFEWLALARWQPAPRWRFEGKLIYYKQGRDSGSTSFGSNIFLPNKPPYRQQDYGFKTGSGIASKTAYASLLASFEMKPNFFIEAQAVVRKENAILLQPSKNNFIMQGGIRWNLPRREFEF